MPRRTLSCSSASREPRRAIPRSPPYSEASHDLVASERGARAYGILQHGYDIQRFFSCRPLQISRVAAASTIPVTSAVAQAKIRKSFRILVIAAPLRTRHRLGARRNPAFTKSRWKYLQPASKRLNVDLVPDREPRPAPSSHGRVLRSLPAASRYWRSRRMAERIAKLATMAMIAVCPQLNPIPVPTRKKPNSDQAA